MKLRSIILKQYMLGSWIGGFKYQFSRTLFYQALPNMLLLAFAAINNIQQRFPWLTLPILIGLVMVVYVVLIVLDHMFVQPSEIAWGNKQGYAHGNPVKSDFVKLNERMDGVEKQLASIEKAVKDLLRKNDAH